jgi:hypothetical protein
MVRREGAGRAGVCVIVGSWLHHCFHMDAVGGTAKTSERYCV